LAESGAPVTALNALTALTDFGDLAVLLPIAIVVFVWLYFLPSKRDAVWWVAAATLCMGGTALLKIFFVTCPLVAELHSPSGHTSLSTLVYGAIALFVAAADARWRYAMIAAGGGVVLLIAASRIALRDHTMLEAGLGLVIGGIALCTFARSYLAIERPTVPLRPLLLSVAVLLVFLHGRQLHAEDLLRAIGSYIHETSGVCSAD
jgi:membrane-associated phospholipid phosphatase